MYITYYFPTRRRNSYSSDEEYNYEVENYDALDYLFQTHGEDEMMRDFANEGRFDELSKKEQEWLTNEFGFDGSINSLEIAIENDWDPKDMITETSIEDIMLEDMYFDELKEYYEPDAWEEFNDRGTYEDEVISSIFRR